MWVKEVKPCDPYIVGSISMELCKLGSNRVVNVVAYMYIYRRSIFVVRNVCALHES